MPSESTYPSIDIPNVDIWGYIFERKDRDFPDDKVIYTDADTSRSYTFAQAKAGAFEFGKGLRALWDWQKGDVLAVYSPNTVDFPIVTWGCHWAGGILSPANAAYTVEELAFQLKDSRARALVTQKAFLPIALAAARKVGIEDEYVILMGDERDPTAKHKHFTSVRNISGAQRYRRARVKPAEDLAFLVYSSGTTGYPKGVMLTHRNIVANILQVRAGESGNLSSKGGPSNEGDKILAFLPFFHIYGLNLLIHQAADRGFQLVVMPKFDLEKFCQTVQKHRITFVYLVPPVALALSKHPVVDKYDLSSIKMTNSGAAPLTHEIVQAVHDRLKIPVKQGYGLSETSPTTHVQPWGEWNKSIGSVGRLLPNMVAKYMSEDGKEVAAGETGELWVKGPNIFKGYLNNPEGTKHALTDDGFFKTGDVGHQDKDGNFFITDRVKELIKYNGFQVAPAELEGILTSHDKVDDAGVIGIFNKEQATELPRAYLVLKQGVPKSKQTEEEILAWVHQRVAPQKRIRGGVRFVDEIPKSASGKILRRVLKEQAAKESPKAKL